MALPPEPDGLTPQINHGGVQVRLHSHELDISEWEVKVTERRLMVLTGDSWVIPLTDLVAVKVLSSSRAADHHSLLLKTKEESVYVGAGARLDHLEWVMEAIREAERTRARREGKEGREYLFERVVPDEVKDLIDR